MGAAELNPEIFTVNIIRAIPPNSTERRCAKFEVRKNMGWEWREG